MEQILALVKDYGLLVYALLLVYCAVKSGTLPLFAGAAAQAGALDPALVAAVTFTGGYIGDEARFASHAGMVMAGWQANQSSPTSWQQRGLCWNVTERLTFFFIATRKACARSGHSPPA